MEAGMKINAIASEAASLHVIAITVDCRQASSAAEAAVRTCSRYKRLACNLDGTMERKVS
jgi:hypothetical protein